MSDYVIKVENLGKSYVIKHKGRERYTTLRDVLTNSIRHAGRHLWGQTNGVGPSQEAFWALKDISFEVKPGERVGIIGRNGAGKSTLLKILSRITEPTEGRVRIKGRVASLLEVGTGFHRELTGRENIYLNGAILGMSRAEIRRKFDEIVAFAEVDKFLDTPVKHYSSGMYVRLAFAVAAHLEPEILLVDEVLAVGDFQFQKKCLGKMGEVADEGRTVLFVSHNMAAMNRLCERCLLLDNGKLALLGPTDKVIPAYLAQSEHTAGLLEVNIGKQDVAIIREVGIINARGEFAHTVEAEKDFFIWIRCLVKEKLEQAQIAIDILSAVDGTVAFVSTHTDKRPIDDTTLLPGDYQAKVRIPGSFLNIGTYTLHVRIWGQLNGRKRASYADAFHILSFRVEETGSLASKLSDQRQGLVTPLLDWEFL